MNTLKIRRGDARTAYFASIGQTRFEIYTNQTEEGKWRLVEVGPDNAPACETYFANFKTLRSLLCERAGHAGRSGESIRREQARLARLNAQESAEPRPLPDMSAQLVRGRGRFTVRDVLEYASGKTGIITTRGERLTVTLADGETAWGVATVS